MFRMLLCLLLFALCAGLSCAEDFKTSESSGGRGDIIIEAPVNRQLQLLVELPLQLKNEAEWQSLKEMASVVAADMNLSGALVAEVKEMPRAESLFLSNPDYTAWQTSGGDWLVRSECFIKGDELTVEFRLYDLISRKQVAARRMMGKTKNNRRFAHMFSDEILLALTGEKGSFDSRIAYVSLQKNNKEIAVMDWDGHNPLPLTKNGSINLNPEFSPDGREVLFTSYKRGNTDLYRRLLTNPTEIPVSNRKGLNITGAYSPDGAKIALTLSSDGNSEIYTIGKDGSKPVRLTNNEAIDVSPVWSPDGTRIAFVSDRFGKPQIFVMNADGSDVKRLTSSGAYNVNPRWSPKGDRVAYARMMGGAFQIFVINADGSGDQQLTSSGSNDTPSWSPDGRLIAFSSKRDGAEAIYVMRADGNSQTRVSQGKAGSNQPAWGRR